MRIWVWVVAKASLAGLSAYGETMPEQALHGAAAGGATAVEPYSDRFTRAVVGSAGNLLFCQANPGQCS